jgi:hypothetical protein
MDKKDFRELSVSIKSGAYKGIIRSLPNYNHIMVAKELRERDEKRVRIINEIFNI